MHISSCVLAHTHTHIQNHHQKPARPQKKHPLFGPSSCPSLVTLLPPAWSLPLSLPAQSTAVLPDWASYTSFFCGCLFFTHLMCHYVAKSAPLRATPDQDLKILINILRKFYLDVYIHLCLHGGLFLLLREYLSFHNHFCPCLFCKGLDTKASWLHVEGSAAHKNALPMLFVISRCNI